MLLQLSGRTPRQLVLALSGSPVLFAPSLDQILQRLMPSEMAQQRAAAAVGRSRTSNTCREDTGVGVLCLSLLIGRGGTSVNTLVGNLAVMDPLKRMADVQHSRSVGLR